MIRRANENDVKSITNIRINGWKTAYKGIVDDNFLNNLDYKRDYEKFFERIIYQDDSNSIQYFVYEDDITKEVLGFTSFGNPTSDKYVLKNSYDCELYALYIKPENKRQGIGKELIAFVKNYFKQNNKTNMILFCLKDNYPSRKFYLANGGIEAEEIEKQIGERILKKIGYSFKL